MNNSNMEVCNPGRERRQDKTRKWRAGFLGRQSLPGLLETLHKGSGLH